jgi:hypothetical protein
MSKDVLTTVSILAFHKQNLSHRDNQKKANPWMHKAHHVYNKDMGSTCAQSGKKGMRNAQVITVPCSQRTLPISSEQGRPNPDCTSAFLGSYSFKWEECLATLIFLPLLSVLSHNHPITGICGSENYTLVPIFWMMNDTFLLLKQQDQN